MPVSFSVLSYLALHIQDIIAGHSVLSLKVGKKKKRTVSWGKPDQLDGKKCS